MSTHTFEVTVNPQEKIQELVDSIEIYGIGADGASQYEITNSSVEGDEITLQVELEVERVEGKFVSADDIESFVIDELQADDDITGVEVLDRPTKAQVRAALKAKADRDSINDSIKDRAHELGIDFDITDAGLVVTSVTMDRILIFIADHTPVHEGSFS